MGFTIVEPLALDHLGISLSNLYVTFRGCLSIIKVRTPSIINIEGQVEQQQDKYRIEGRLSVFVTQDQSNRMLAPLKQENVSISVNSFPSDPMAMLYEKAKELFSEKTFIDM